MDHLVAETRNENRIHIHHCGKIVEEHSVAGQVRSTGVAEKFEQAQTEWKQKIAHTVAQKSENTEQKLGHTGAHIGAQKPARTVAAGTVAAGTEAGGSVAVAAAAAAGCCSAYLP